MIKLILILLLVYVWNSSFVLAVDFQKQESDKVQLEVIIERVNKGERQALLDTVKLDQSVAIPYLSHYVLDPITEPALYDMACTVLASINGHGDYLRQYILDHPSDLGVKVNTFRVLSRLKTKEAVNAIAYFLLNDLTPALNKGDVFISSGKTMAAKALARMNLPNPPTYRNPGAYEDTDAIKWQKWWSIHQKEYQ